MRSAIRPAKLEPGMTIGVVATSSGIRDPRLASGMAKLTSLGYQVRPAAHLYDQAGYLAGLDSARGADLTAMFGDRSVDAIMCGRGGYGAARMLDHVDWELVAANPKLFIGFSDITTLHLALERRVGLITIHGPTVTTLGGGLSESAESSLWRLLCKPEPLGALVTEWAAITTLVGGRAEGALAGGCLSLLAAAVGTPDAPDFRDRIVLIEDVGERIYRIDRMLMQLRRAGVLESAAGFVLGTNSGWEELEPAGPTVDLLTVWRDYIVPLGKPAISGFPFGHVPNPLSLPLGCLARLDADSGTVSILEPAVR